NPKATELKVWDASTGAVLLDLSQPGGRSIPALFAQGGCVAFSPDGTRFVAGGFMQSNLQGPTKTAEPTVYDASTGAAACALKGHAAGLHGACFSPGGPRTVTGGGAGDRRALVWDAATGARLPIELKGHTSAVLCAAFSPDGTRIVTGSMDRTVRVW